MKKSWNEASASGGPPIIDGECPFLAPTMQVRAYVSPEFEEAVLLHVVKNHLPQFSPALILAIQGPKGEGKTFQIREVLSRMGVFAVPISGANLSGSTERASVEAFEKAYMFASVLRHTQRKMSCVVVDDFDLSAASILKNREYTVNSQLLIGFLMNLCDNPTFCGGRSTNRTPIVITGNDFTSLHAPLIRHGRANIFSWAPTAEHKTQVFRSIFNRLLQGWSDAEISAFIEEFKSETAGFFSMLLDDCLSVSLNKVINEVGLRDFALLQSRLVPLLERPVDYRTLQVIAQKRRTSNLAVNFNTRE
jgi:hypothetical protein